MARRAWVRRLIVVPTAQGSHASARQRTAALPQAGRRRDAVVGVGGTMAPIASLVVNRNSVDRGPGAGPAGAAHPAHGRLRVGAGAIDPLGDQVENAARPRSNSADPDPHLHALLAQASHG